MKYIKSLVSFLKTHRPSSAFVLLSTLPFFAIFFVLIFELLPTSLSYFRHELSSKYGIAFVIGSIIFIIAIFYSLVKVFTNQTHASLWLRKVIISIPVISLLVFISDDSCSGFMCLWSAQEFLAVIGAFSLLCYSFYTIISFEKSGFIMKSVLILVAGFISIVFCVFIGSLWDAFDVIRRYIDARY